MNHDPRKTVIREMAKTAEEILKNDDDAAVISRA